MKQVLLSGAGEVDVFDVPLPAPLPNSLLVRNAYSAISSGTESAAVSRQRGLLGTVEKAFASTERIAKAWRLVQTHGVHQAWNTIQSTLDQWRPVGYSGCGQVVETHGEQTGFAPGDWVACMGVGLANHAEYVVVPARMAARLPPGAAPDEAAFGALARAAQHGIRNLELTPGETIVVIGLGLIGTLAVATAQAMGYEVYGLDRSASRVAHCQRQYRTPCFSDAAELKSVIEQVTSGHGTDGVLIAAATSNSDLIQLAADLCRPRGRISIVGDVGLELDREKIYRKEIDVRVSCSYGPGRYDATYELEGRDYPIGHVRWTLERNLQFFLRLLATGRLSVRPFISHTFDVGDAVKAYELVKQSRSDARGVLFRYAQHESEAANLAVDHGASRNVLPLAPPTSVVEPQRLEPGRPIRIGVIGCGAFATNMHLPMLARLKSQFRLVAAASRSGVSAAAAARRFQIPEVVDDPQRLLADPQIDAVLIAMRHSSHAALVRQALEHGKHVFVEKPLCLSVEEGRDIVALADAQRLTVRVGFNRRYAPMLRQLREAIGTRGPRVIRCRLLIAASQRNHWSNSTSEGGRFLGEAVHFFDLCNWFVGAEAISIDAHAVGEAGPTHPDLLTIVRYADGSAAEVTYLSRGNTQLGKEFYEAHGNERSATCDDFRTMVVRGARVQSGRMRRGDKGHLAQWLDFHAALTGGAFYEEPANAKAGMLATQMAVAAVQSAQRCASAITMPRSERGVVAMPSGQAPCGAPASVPASGLT